MKFLDFTRNSVTFTNEGNPDRSGNLQTVGLPKAAINIITPNIGGMNETNAIATLTADGLGYNRAAGTGGTIIGQSPLSGEMIAKGMSVNAFYAP